MSHQKGKCLLLNSDYTPLTIVSWQKAMVWSLRYLENPNYGIQIIAYHNKDTVYASNNRLYKVPSIARSVHYFNLFNKTINFSRKNLFLRDNHTCQYCGQKLTANQLTYDHVIPKSRYSEPPQHCTNWNNIVTACIKCNRQKGNKTPEEAGMILMNRPCSPKFCKKYLHSYIESVIIKCDVDSSQWSPFLSHE